MNDFKRYIDNHVYGFLFEEINFDAISTFINNMLINVHTIGYTDANSIMNRLPTIL